MLENVIKNHDFVIVVLKILLIHYYSLFFTRIQPVNFTMVCLLLGSFHEI